MKSVKLLNGWTFTDSSGTRDVRIPHDFMLETKRTADSRTGADYGYFQPCRGDYRLKIIKPDAKNCFLRFDGVMGLTTVYVNGETVKFHPYGYTSFICDISGYLKDGENELRVSVDATAQPASRWYTGAGIYREVEMMTSDGDYIVPDSLFVRTLRISGCDASIAADISVFSDTEQEASLELDFCGCGRTVRERVWLRRGENRLSYRAMLKNIVPWSVNDPVLYTCRAALNTADCEDEDSAVFGVRTIDCDPERGFLLNGEPIKLYGACVHHDNGIVGAASHLSSEMRRVRILKENGFNAIRCSHNPPSQNLLEACDRLGMAVIDEIFDCWRAPKKDYDYHLWFEKNAPEDIASMVRRGRNHPSVVMWSTGNEIFERAGRGGGYELGRMIAETVEENDGTRPITHAFCHFWDSYEFGKKYWDTYSYPAEKKDFWCEKIAPQAANLDVLGYNYLSDRYVKDQVRFPGKLFAITESYPVDVVRVKKLMDENAGLIGEFVWTGWDYFGETGLGHIIYDTESTAGWSLLPHPNHIANCGDFSICGFKKPQSYYRDAAWKKGSVSILAVDPKDYKRKYAISSWGFYNAERSWSYPGSEGKTTSVFLYTLADECELFVDGVSAGKKAPDENGIAEFEVCYKPGKLEAAAYINGEVSGRDILETSKEPVKLSVKADVTAGDPVHDVVYIEIQAVDEAGKRAVNAENEITVTAEGGMVAGTGSGKIDDEHSYTENTCRLYQGRALAAILPESGKITVTVSSEGFDDATVELEI